MEWSTEESRMMFHETTQFIDSVKVDVKLMSRKLDRAATEIKSERKLDAPAVTANCLHEQSCVPLRFLMGSREDLGKAG